MRTVPVIVIPSVELGALPIDDSSDRVLRCIDGRADVEAVVGACGLVAEEARAVLGDLVAIGAVTLVDVDERLTARRAAARR